MAGAARSHYIALAGGIPPGAVERDQPGVTGCSIARNATAIDCGPAGLVTSKPCWAAAAKSYCVSHHCSRVAHTTTSGDQGSVPLVLKVGFVPRPRHLPDGSNTLIVSSDLEELESSTQNTK